MKQKPLEHLKNTIMPSWQNHRPADTHQQRWFFTIAYFAASGHRQGIRAGVNQRNGGNKAEDEEAPHGGGAGGRAPRFQ